MKTRDKLKRLAYASSASALRRVGLMSLLAHYNLHHRSYLTDRGWFQSVATGAPLDGRGEPLPWLVYPVIDLLAERVQPSWRVFEFGSGASSRWWAARVALLVSVEHDRAWYEQLAAAPPPNLTLLWRALEDGYAESILQREERFEIVVVDGRKRVRCALHALERLTDDGVIIWDNSERPHYKPGLDELVKRGFKLLPVKGFAPSSAVSQQTTICYRAQNCLGL